MGEVRVRFGRGSGDVREVQERFEGFRRCSERFKEVQERFGRGRERNGAVTREEKGQLGKRQERRRRKK